MEHAPRGFVRHSSFALNLFGGNATPGTADQVHRVEPDSQRCARLLEDRSGQRVDVISARLASEGRAPFDAVVFLRLLVAFVAVGDAAGEALLFDRFETSVIIWELPVKLLKGIAKMGWNCLAAIHDTRIMPFVHLVVKGYLPTPPPPVF